MIRKQFPRGVFLALLVTILGACAGDPTATDCDFDREANEFVCVES